MNVTNSIVDFFQGNPFQNPVGSLIEKATDCKNEIENWTLYMEVCDVINAMEDGPKLAIRAIKRRIVTEINKDVSVVLYTLTLLETCVKNCGYRFHLVVCSKDFLQEFEKLILNTNNQNKSEIPIVVRNRILGLLQVWYDSFKGQPDLREIEIIYIFLIDCGVQFPMTDLNTMSPINTPKRNLPHSMPMTAKPVNGDVVTAIPPDSIVTNLPEFHSASSEKIIDKLSKDLQAVQANLDMMCELMNENPSTGYIPDDAISLMKNLFETNSEMQKRLLQLINRWEETQLKDSSILFDMLRVNDEMNSALAQYSRFERAITGAASKPENNDEIATRISKSNISDVYASQQEAEHFYDGISKATKSSKTNQKSGIQSPDETVNLISTDNNTNSSRPSLNALTSQEFDQFLFEQAQTSFSINSDQSQVTGSRRDRQDPFGAKPKSENSQLFDL